MDRYSLCACSRLLTIIKRVGQVRLYEYGLAIGHIVQVHAIHIHINKVILAENTCQSSGMYMNTERPHLLANNIAGRPLYKNIHSQNNLV